MRETNHVTIKSYVIGYILSLVLTVTAFFLITQHVSSHHAVHTHQSLIALVVGLAITQFFVQLLFFLHLSRESKPRWNLTIFLFMLMVLVILVFGSLWIMNNLNYHMMSPTDTDNYIIHDEGIHR